MVNAVVFSGPRLFAYSPLTRVILRRGFGGDFISASPILAMIDYGDRSDRKETAQEVALAEIRNSEIATARSPNVTVLYRERPVSTSIV